MLKIAENMYCPYFEYLYMFVMVIFMGQMTAETSRMVGGLSGNPIPFLIPIVLTLILINKNPIAFGSKKLIYSIGTFAIWSIAIAVKYSMKDTEEASYLFFLFYAIFIAYIHIKVYGSDYFPIYEHIMVVFATISLVLWPLGFIAGPFFRIFPETHFGNNFLYLFNWMDPAKGQIYGHVIRNAGCSWEPGRFAIMLTLAIAVNIAREGITFRNNKNISILILALASTLSTTGYSIAILLYTLFWFREYNTKNSLRFVLFFIPIVFAISSLSFMSEKIESKINLQQESYERDKSMAWHAKTGGDEHIASLDRFESIYFEYQNFLKDPILGYSRNKNHSWFYKQVSKNFTLTGGLVKIFSQYGLIMGIIIYMILLYSSIKISKTSKVRSSLAIFLTLLLSSISYPIFCIPVFMSFWMYGLFGHEEDELEETEGDAEEYTELENGTLEHV